VYRGLQIVACGSWPAVRSLWIVACGSWPAVRGHHLDVIIFTERSCVNIAMDIYTKLLWIVVDSLILLD
jgi:hypothetical protein